MSMRIHTCATNCVVACIGQAHVQYHLGQLAGASQKACPPLSEALPVMRIDQKVRGMWFKMNHLPPKLLWQIPCPLEPFWAAKKYKSAMLRFPIGIGIGSNVFKKITHSSPSSWTLSNDSRKIPSSFALFDEPPRRLKPRRLKPRKLKKEDSMRPPIRLWGKDISLKV